MAKPEITLENASREVEKLSELLSALSASVSREKKNLEAQGRAMGWRR